MFLSFYKFGLFWSFYFSWVVLWYLKWKLYFAPLVFSLFTWLFIMVPSCKLNMEFFICERWMSVLTVLSVMVQGWGVCPCSLGLRFPSSPSSFDDLYFYIIFMVIVLINVPPSTQTILIIIMVYFSVIVFLFFISLSTKSLIIARAPSSYMESLPPMNPWRYIKLSI